MVNYNNGKIYKIEPLNGEEGDIYIGSTTKNLLSQRMDTHRRGYKGFLRGDKNRFTTSFNLFNKYGVENCKIILIELVNVNSKDELLIREAHYIKTLNCVNKCIPLRSVKEYQQQNKEQIKEQRKEYYEENKEKIKERVKEYHQQNKEKIKEYQNEYIEQNKEKIKHYNNEYKIQNKEKIKEYREQNKEKIKEYREQNKEKRKEYLKQNKEKINEKQREYRKLKKEKLIIN